MKPSRLGFETGTWHRHKDLQLYLLCRETIKKKKKSLSRYLNLEELGEPNETIPFANLCHNYNFFISAMTIM